MLGPRRGAGDRDHFTGDPLRPDRVPPLWPTPSPKRAAGRLRARDARPQPLDGRRPGAGPPILGTGPRIHPDHDQPGRARRPLLPGRPGQQGHHRLFGQQLSHLYAESDLPAGLRVGRRGGRALVDPDPFPAHGSGRPWPAGHGDRLAGRFVHGRQRRVLPRSTRPSARWASSRPWRPMWRWCMPRRPTARATWSSPSLCSKACGEPGPPGGAWWPRWTKVVDDLHGLGHRVRVPAHRVLAVVEAPFGAHPGGCYAPGLPVRSYGEDIAFWSMAAEAAAKGSSMPSPRSGCSGPPPTTSTCAETGPRPPAWLEGRSDPQLAGGRRSHTGARRPGGRPGSRQPPWGPARWSGWWPTWGPTPCWPEPAWPTWPPGWPWPGPGPQAAGSRSQPSSAVGLRADAGRPVHLQSPGVSRHAVSLRRVGGPRHGHRWPGHAHRGLPRCGRGGSHRLPQLDRAGRRPIPGRLRRGQRCGQPGQRLRRGHLGPTRALARHGGLRHIAGPSRGQCGDRQGRPAPPRRDAAGGRRARREGTLAERTRALVESCGYTPDVARTVEELAPVRRFEVGALREFDRQRLFLN
jgi:hypothetical protein